MAQPTFSDSFTGGVTGGHGSVTLLSDKGIEALRDPRVWVPLLFFSSSHRRLHRGPSGSVVVSVPSLVV